MSDNTKMLREALFGKFFTCPQCGKALCRESELGNFNDDYCVNCGYEITSAKRKALALVAKEI